MRTRWVIAVALMLSSAGAGAQSGVVILREAWALPAFAGSDVHVFLTIENRSTMPLAIMRTSSTAADSVGSIGLGAQGGDGEQLASAFFVAPGREIHMLPGHPHLLLFGISRDVRVGDQLALTLHMLGDRDIPVRVTVRAPNSIVGVPVSRFTHLSTHNRGHKQARTAGLSTEASPGWCWSPHSRVAGARTALDPSAPAERPRDGEGRVGRACPWGDPAVQPNVGSQLTGGASMRS